MNALPGLGSAFFAWVGKMIGQGRQIITTPYREITADNVIDVIQKSMAKFRQNIADCDYLIDYYYGEQPLQRKEEKQVMEWIDFQNVDNVARYVAEFWSSFADGIPITLIQRGDADINSKKAAGIAEINNQYAMTGLDRATQKLAFFKHITGIVYTLVDINREYEEGEAVFTRDVLDPRTAFVVRSSYYPDRRIMLGVTVCMDEDKHIYFTAYSKDNMYIIKANKIINGGRKEPDFVNDYAWTHEERSGEENPLHRIQVCEWVRAEDRTGVFECQISSLDNLNLLSSNISNGVQQGIEAYWWTNDVELEKKAVTDEEGNVTLVDQKPKPGDWLHTNTLRNGSKPSIQSLTIDYHISDMVDNYVSQRTIVLQQCHVPQQGSNRGVTSGVAMDIASGWADAENIASAQECITKGCQMEELKVVLAAIKESPDTDVDSPMLDVLASDVEPSIRRPRNFEVSIHVNAFAALIAKGVSVEDALAAAPIVPDAAQFVARSGEGIKKYQEANVWGGNADENTHLADNMDAHTEHSPLIDSMEMSEEEIDAV